jgi:UPF0042 nucleotide-binding protein
MSELTIMSFAYARGEPPEANLLFDMRFLRNPHWQEHLRPLSGLDEEVGAYIGADPAYADALSRIEALLLTLLPLYQADGKALVRVAFGCTGGRHRSVHVAEHVALRLRDAGFSPRLDHRDLAAPPRDGTERSAGARQTAAKVK